MIRTLKTLLGLAQREDATTAELAPSLPVAEAELAAARTAQLAAEEAYRSSLLSTEEAGNRADAERRDASRRLDRAEALVAALKQRMVEAQGREAEVARVERYEAARRRGDDAAAALVELYPHYAQSAVDLLKSVMEAEVEISAVNHDLPRDTPQLLPIERRIRDASSGAWLPPLGEVLSLPALRAGEPWFYKPIERPFQGNTSPSEILGRIRQRIF